MPEDEIVFVYVGLIRQRRRFVVHRRNGSGRDMYEVFKPRTLRDFIVRLLTIPFNIGDAFRGLIAGGAMLALAW